MEDGASGYCFKFNVLDACEFNNRFNDAFKRIEIAFKCTDNDLCLFLGKCSGDALIVCYDSLTGDIYLCHFVKACIGIIVVIVSCKHFKH